MLLRICLDVLLFKIIIVDPWIFNWFYVLLNIQQPFHYIILKQHIFFLLFFWPIEKPSLNLFNTVGVYKINLENSADFLYASRKHVEEEGMETISFQIALKIPWNKLRDTEVSSRYNENFKILKREIKLN